MPVIANRPFEPESRSSWSPTMSGMSQHRSIRSYSNCRLRLPPKQLTGCHNLPRSRYVRTNRETFAPPPADQVPGTYNENHLGVNNANPPVAAVMRRFGYGRVCWKYLIGRSSLVGGSMRERLVSQTIDWSGTWKRDR